MTESPSSGLCQVVTVLAKRPHVPFKGHKMVLKFEGLGRCKVFVALRPVWSKRVEPWTVWSKRAEVLSAPRQGAQGGGGKGGGNLPPSTWSSTPDQRVGGFFDDLLRSALARRPAYTLRMYTLLRMPAPCLASALSRYHPGWDPTPRTPPPGTPPLTPRGPHHPPTPPHITPPHPR
jgi:hypothetical protein